MTETINGFPVGARVMNRSGNRELTVVSYHEWNQYRVSRGELRMSPNEIWVPVRFDNGRYNGYRPESLRWVEEISKPTVLHCDGCGGRWVATSGYPTNRCSECSN